MPYLPPTYVNQTNMPLPWGRDIQHTIRLIEEQYRRFRTQILYVPLSKNVTPAIDFDHTVGVNGTTKFDPLYGEAVDSTMDEVEQPQLSGRYQSANPELFLPGIKIYAKVQIGNLDNQLKKFGFDKTRDLLVSVPCSMLDAAGITVMEGSYIDWDGHQYEIEEQTPGGYWKNTNIFLYIVFACMARRIAS